MRLRISNYTLSRYIFEILSFILRRLKYNSFIFDKIVGHDYKNRHVDKYYLVRITKE